jgi:hypothetical protein
VIEDPHERTRAILWMLADADPGMPLVRALGHLKAVELELDRLARSGVLEENSGGAPDPKYSGPHGPSNLVKDMASERDVVKAARTGSKTGTAAAIVKAVGVGAAPAACLVLAADSLVNMYSGT